MRRKRARTINWLALAGMAALAVFGPRAGSLQATTALAFAPVSHPANRVGNWLAGALGDEAPADPVSPRAPRELRAVAEENDRLRQRIEQLQGHLAVLQQVNQDRQSLGKDVLPFCSALLVIGGDSDVLQVINTGRAKLSADLPVLHYGSVQSGVAGVIGSVGASGAQVRLISDPAVRIEGLFGRFDAATNQFVALSTEPPLIEGAGDGMCQVARAKRDEIDHEKLVVGDWAVLADRSWPEQLRYFRIGQVAEIQEIPAEPGFVRVLIRPAVELRGLKELMVFRRDEG